MKICFPVEEPMELKSRVYGHFGSAPAFLLVDTDTGNPLLITNDAPQHTKGACSPLKTLGGHDIDSVVVGGIGKTALVKLNAQGITVYRSGAETVRENLDLLKKKQLPIFSPGEVCAGHGHGCSH
jgi:predicted Fe-Mo cluster-binding NifX family protein